jgi:hypothetical protein
LVNRLVFNRLDLTNKSIENSISITLLILPSAAADWGKTKSGKNNQEVQIEEK